MTAARAALACAVRWATGRTGRLCLVCGRGGEAVFPTAEAAMQRADADVGESLAWHALGDVLYVAETPIGSSYVVERAELVAENGHG